MTHIAPSARGAEFWQGSATKISLLVCPATHHFRIAEIARRPHPQVFALRRGAARFLAVLEPAGARQFRGVASRVGGKALIPAKRLLTSFPAASIMGPEHARAAHRRIAPLPATG